MLLEYSYLSISDYNMVIFSFVGKIFPDCHSMVEIAVIVMELEFEFLLSSQITDK